MTPKKVFFREIPLDVLTMPDSKRKSLGGEQQYDKVLIVMIDDVPMMRVTMN